MLGHNNPMLALLAALLLLMTAAACSDDSGSTGGDAGPVPGADATGSGDTSAPIGDAVGSADAASPDDDDQDTTKGGDDDEDATSDDDDEDATSGDDDEDAAADDDEDAADGADAGDVDAGDADEVDVDAGDADAGDVDAGDMVEVDMDVSNIKDDLFGQGDDADTAGDTAASACPLDDGLCDPVPAGGFQSAFKMSSLQIGDSGTPGNGLDIDDKGPADCAPLGCTDGIDNALAILATFANGPLNDAVASGQVFFMGELATNADGSMQLNLFTGDLDISNPDCAFNSDVCSYVADLDAFDCDCKPVMQFDAMIDGKQLVAGGDGAALVLDVPLGDVVLQVSVTNARLEADIGPSPEGLELNNGVIGGAIAKTDLSAAVEAIPGDNIGGIPKSIIMGIVDGLTADIDGDGDGVDESVSIGLKFEAIPGFIVGVQ